MGHHRILDKDFNPYDLGSVARVSREFQERGYYGSPYSEPYVPVRSKQDRGSSTRLESTGQDTDRKS
jgi:hypothetical protein